MNPILLSSFCIVMVAVLTMQVRGTDLPEDDLLAGYDPGDIAATLQQMEEPQYKRAIMCRQGFTYQSILRRCVPSLGALRGRGRKGRFRNN